MDNVFELEQPLADLIDTLTRLFEKTNDKKLEEKIERLVQRRIELYQMLPKSRTEAIALGQTHYFNGKPCRNGHFRMRRTSDAHCLQCDSNYQKRKRKRRPKAVSKMRKAYYKKTREHQLQLRKDNYANNEEVRLKKKDKDLRKTYGITLDDYYALAEKQEHACALCFSTETNKRTNFFDVDHCHETGKVRGLLCTNCNQGLGKFKDDASLLERAIAYLKSND